MNVWVLTYPGYDIDQEPCTNTLIFSTEQKANEWACEYLDHPRRDGSVFSYEVDSGEIYD